ncbi:unnamed protein product [Rotaria sp. Silwood1]|nr:unnamed protein product [Rotaria sp. Silwood1]
MLTDVKGGLAKTHHAPINSYKVTFENIKVVRGYLDRTGDGTHFEYRQSPKGLKFKTEEENDEQAKQAAEEDEVKEPKEGKTYLAILENQEHIEVLVEIDPKDINEIIQSARDKQTTIV